MRYKGRAHGHHKGCDKPCISRPR